MASSVFVRFILFSVLSLVVNGLPAPSTSSSDGNLRENFNMLNEQYHALQKRENEAYPGLPVLRLGLPQSASNRILVPFMGKRAGAGTGQFTMSDYFDYVIKPELDGNGVPTVVVPARSSKVVFRGMLDNLG